MKVYYNSIKYYKEIDNDTNLETNFTVYEDLQKIVIDFNIYYQILFIQKIYLFR